MIVKKGKFISEHGKFVEYEIDEEVIEGKYTISFKQLDDILSYSKREATFKIELYEKRKSVIPIKIRTLEEYIEIIEEFYKSDKCKYMPDNIPVVRCNIEKINDEYTKDSLSATEEGKKYIQNQAELRGISIEDMIEYIDTHKRSGYSR